MRKILTLTAAIMASFSLFAAEPTTIFEWGDMAQSSLPNPTVGSLECLGISGYANVKINTNAEKVYGLKADGSMVSSNVVTKYIKIKPAAGEKFLAGDTVIFTHVYNNSSAKTTTIAVANVENNAILFEGTQTVNGRTANGWTTDKYVLKAKADSLALGRVGSTSTFVLSIKVLRPAPATEPVTEVNISGETEMYVDRTITLSASTDVLADEYKWSVNGEDVAGATTAEYEFTPTAAGTYSIICSAKNSFNSDWVASAAHSVVATVKDVLTRVDVTESTTWDFSKVSGLTEIKLTDATTPKKNDTTLLANVDDVVNDENFNSQALLFAGEYIVREGKYCQGTDLIFNTTVAGTLKIKYSNTGSSNGTRYVWVNGAKIDGDLGSADTNAHEASVAVEAGEVRIAAGVKADSTREMLRFSVITFTKDDGGATAIDNTDAAVKATKVLRDGQVLILRDGKFFNALGVEVK